MTGTANTAEGDKILIVDDDPGLSSLLERFFTSKGYRARAVPNTEQMDRLLQREVFNLVVLDLMLPGEDGLSACKRLRQSNNQIPIIMLTAKGTSSAASRAWSWALTTTWASRSTRTS
jgi:Two-component response regulator OmpR